MGCTRNGTWGDPFGGAVLVNPFVRSRKIIMLTLINKFNYLGRVQSVQVQLHVAYAINTALDKKA